MTGTNISDISGGSCGVSTATILSGVFFGELRNTSSIDEVSSSRLLCKFGENKNESVPSVGFTLLCPAPGVGDGPCPTGGSRSPGSSPLGGEVSGGLKPPPIGGGLSVITEGGVSAGVVGGVTDAWEVSSSGGLVGWLDTALNISIAAGRKNRSTTSTTVRTIFPRSVNS